MLGGKGIACSHRDQLSLATAVPMPDKNAQHPSLAAPFAFREGFPITGKDDRVVV